MNRKEIIDLLQTIPGSYPDFVNDTTDWMEKDDEIRSAILEQIAANPASDTDDITLVLWKCLGIGNPIEIVDDNEQDALLAFA